HPHPAAPACSYTLSLHDALPIFEVETRRCPKLINTRNHWHVAANGRSAPGRPRRSPSPNRPGQLHCAARLFEYLPAALAVSALRPHSNVWVSPNVTYARVCLLQSLLLGARNPMWHLCRRRDDHPHFQHRHIQHDPTVDRLATWQVRARTLLSSGQYWSQYAVARPVE